MKRLLLIIAIVIVLVSLNWFKEVFAGELDTPAAKCTVDAKTQNSVSATAHVNADVSGTP